MATWRFIVLCPLVKHPSSVIFGPWSFVYTIASHVFTNWTRMDGDINIYHTSLWSVLETVTLTADLSYFQYLPIPVWQITAHSKCPSTWWRVDHIMPVLIDVHWLSIRKWIPFQVNALSYMVLHNLAPHYLKSLLNLHISARPYPTIQLLLQVPMHQTADCPGLLPLRNGWVQAPLDIRHAQNSTYLGWNWN